MYVVQAYLTVAGIGLALLATFVVIGAVIDRIDRRK